MKTFNTRKSLYAPVEIQVDDKVYQSIKLTHLTMVEAAKIEERIRVKETSSDATYEWVGLIFGIDKAILEKLEDREVEDIYLYAGREFREVEKERMKKEIDSFDSQLKQMKRVDKVKKDIPSSKNSKRSGDKK